MENKLNHLKPKCVCETSDRFVLGSNFTQLADKFEYWNTNVESKIVCKKIQIQKQKQQQICRSKAENKTTTKTYNIK